MVINCLAKTLTIALLSGGMYFYLNPQPSHALPQQAPNLISSLDAAALYARGVQKQQKGDFKGAIADFTEAIRLKPDYEDAYLERYRLKFKLGDKQGALADINKMISLKPNHILYSLRGIVKSSLGDTQGAISDYTETIRLDPKYVPAYLYRADAKSSFGDKKGAIADYNEAIRLANRDPSYANAYHGRGLAKSSTASIRLNPKNADAYFNRGFVNKERGDKQKALVDFREAARLYKLQGNTTWFNNAIQRIRELGGSL